MTDPYTRHRDQALTELTDARQMNGQPQAAAVGIAQVHATLALAAATRGENVALALEEAYPNRTGAALIVAERRRQIEEEGWSPEHDQEHDSDQLALAAVCYALPPDGYVRLAGADAPPPAWWQWPREYWKPTPEDRVRELVKAGALIAAEIDRLRVPRAPGSSDIQVF